ncbi:MAG: aldehyde dehydrogenase family protein [Saprospiraceae bacterium]|nr:aldehyde dehydrogenase family protein [Candidatus Vicinibacter affinis]
MIQAHLAALQLKGENSGSWCGRQSFLSEDWISSFSPVDGKLIGKVSQTGSSDYDVIVHQAHEAFLEWRQVPAPKRGEFVRQLGEELRKHKEHLGALVSFEMGKSLQEGFGEVQEMIDICDFAVGLSRQLYGLTMHSERPLHRMYEQWHPLGVVGVISAFNFPVAVWSWNAALAWVCGNTVIWKPSEKTPLCSVAVQHIVCKVLEKNKYPQGISCIINGNANLGHQLCQDARIPLISATGSTRMGKSIGVTVAERFGKSILELGGNNAVIISETADLKKVLPAIVFGAVGTAGQRCTSTRRLIIHESKYAEVRQVMQKAYGQLRIGNPLDQQNHVGPLIDRHAVEIYLKALEQIKVQGGRMLVEGGVIEGAEYSSGCYVRPCIAEVQADMKIVHEETFAPILYLMTYQTLEEAITIQNNVPQGLSSAIMTESLREAELFLSARGSDCGIANVNIGTSGAEIGGAFGGEKETGGGRESGSDAWKAYMRRQTNTISYSDTLTLAQGIKFDL